MKRIISIGVVIGLVGLISWRLSANKKEINSARSQAAQLQTVPVVAVQLVRPVRVDQTLSLLGTIEAQQEGNIIAETRGKLQHFTLQLGSSVQKGQSVGFVQDEVQGVVVESNQTSAENARRELARYERLLTGGAVTQEAYQAYKDKYTTALLNAKQQQRVLKTGAVLSPVSGQIYGKKVQNGEYVSPGTVLASVINLQALTLVVNVPEQVVYQLKLGDKAQITTAVLPGVSVMGTVHFISPKGDDLHTYAVELYMHNVRNQLKAGTLATARFIVPRGITGLFIPRNALVGGADSAQVYVVKNNRVRLQNVRLGYDQNDVYQVLNGLKEGDSLVVDGQLNLTNGVVVSVNRAAKKVADQP